MKELYFIPIVGTQKIGFNCSLYGMKADDNSLPRWIMVDLGITFGDGKFGYEVILPALDENLENRKVEALIITHVHEDHFGALKYLWGKLKCPIYATKFAVEVMKDKGDGAFKSHADFKVIDHHEPFEVAGFNLRMLPISHSTLENKSIVINTPKGHVFHTGDWKIDTDPVLEKPFDIKPFKKIGKEGVLAVIGDSTNVFSRNGSEVTEQTVYDEIKSILKKNEFKGQIIATCFASNVARLYTLITLGHKMGRKVFVVGRSMKSFIKAAKASGYIKDLPRIYDPKKHAKTVPAKERFVICAGSQGDKRAGLWRIVHDEHPHIKLGKHDSVFFSSKVIPGNEEDCGKITNKLLMDGLNIFTMREYSKIHSSGHACLSDMKVLYDALKPKICIPVHGSQNEVYRHAKFAREEAGVETTFCLSDGDILRIFPKPKVIGKIPDPGGKVVLDYGSDTLIDIDSQLLTFRENIAKAGVVFVSICKKSKQINVSMEGIACNAKSVAFAIKSNVNVKMCELDIVSNVHNVLYSKDIKSKPEVVVHKF